MFSRSICRFIPIGLVVFFPSLETSPTPPFRKYLPNRFHIRRSRFPKDIENGLHLLAKR
jgi:hypothetical protein